MDKIPREIIQKVQMQELWFLCSACHLMLIDIYMKFVEDILNRFQVKEWTRFCEGHSSKGNNPKGIKASYGSVTLHIV